MNSLFISTVFLCSLNHHSERRRKYENFTRIVFWIHFVLEFKVWVFVSLIVVSHFWYTDSKALLWFFCVCVFIWMNTIVKACTGLLIGEMSTIVIILCVMLTADRFFFVRLIFNHFVIWLLIGRHTGIRLNDSSQFTSANSFDQQ